MREQLGAGVVRGMERQLAWRSARLQAGERPIGWKVGFGSPAAMRQLGISVPLVGFLTDASLVEPGSTCSIGGWTRPMFEPEVAVHLAHDVAPGSDRASAERAIGSLGPAIELADVDPPPTAAEEVCASNIFHRRVCLGAGTPGATLRDVSARMFVDGLEVDHTTRPEELTGDAVSLVAHVADVLGVFGERLRSGEAIITGSIVSPRPIEPATRVRYELDPLGELELGFSA